MALDRGKLIELLREDGRLVDCQSIGGGCISQAARVTIAQLDDGTESHLFVKCNSATFLDNFRCEFDGLLRLGQLHAIRVPRPLKVDLAGEYAWLVTEFVQTGQHPVRSRSPESAFQRFGHQLAELHRRSRGQRIGLEYDNYLGSTRQFNATGQLPRLERESSKVDAATTSESQQLTWAEFVQTYRIGRQLRWAIDRGLAGSRLKLACERLIQRIPDLLHGRANETSLLHGDLWSGNYLWNADGEPVIIDPAIYYGCREAEFGMLELYGNCPREFYEAYQSHWPLPEGWERRVQVYVLYHLMNHLILFGGSYAGQCQSCVEGILAEM